MKVTIIGKGDGWQDAPSDGEAWGVNDLILRRNVSRVIQIHNLALASDEGRRVEIATRERAKSIGASYIDSESYPLWDVVKFFESDYFSSTVDYAIALAVFEAYTKIDMYGVNMANPSEYSCQKAGVEFWCGIAKGRGVEVKVFGELSTIMRTGDGLLYGYGFKQNRPK
jgi:hypothetical protein